MVSDLIGPGIEPKISRADSDVFNHFAIWSVIARLTSMKFPFLYFRSVVVNHQLSLVFSPVFFFGRSLFSRSLVNIIESQGTYFVK